MVLILCHTTTGGAALCECVPQFCSCHGKLSHSYFAPGYIVELLECHSCEFQWDMGFVTSTLLELGSSIPNLFTVYDRLFKAKVCVCM